MISAYRDIKWLEVNEAKEGGTRESYKFKKEYGEILYRYIKKEVGEINGINYFDIASYRGAEGPYVLWAEKGREEELITEFKQEFEHYCQDQHIIAEFAKLDPWDQYSEYIKQVYDAQYYGNFYCNNLEIDFYKEEYNRRAKRSIKKAINAGITVRKDFTGITIPQFVELYKNTEDKFHTSDYYRMTESDIRKFFETFGEDAFLINAYLNEEIITSVLVVMGKDVEHYLLLGSNPQYLDLQANSLLTYEAALYGQKTNRKLFDMGGGKAGGGIEQFKLNFSSEKGIWPYYVIEKVYDEEIYDEFVRRKGKVENTKFFPLYRG